MIRCPLCQMRFHTWKTTDRVCQCDREKVVAALADELEEARNEIQRLNDRIDTMKWDDDALDE